MSGAAATDPNMPTYAMLAYMAVVSARLLPKESVCRDTVNEEVTYTPADMRLCSQEISELWQNAAMITNFDKTMDAVQEQLKSKGVDITLVGKAAKAMD